MIIQKFRHTSPNGSRPVIFGCDKHDQGAKQVIAQQISRSISQKVTTI
jgi:hypothetical protein